MVSDILILLASSDPVAVAVVLLMALYFVVCVLPYSGKLLAIALVIFSTFDDQREPITEFFVNGGFFWTIVLLSALIIRRAK